MINIVGITRRRSGEASSVASLVLAVIVTAAAATASATKSRVAGFAKGVGSKRHGRAAIDIFLILHSVHVLVLIFQTGTTTVIRGECCGQEQYQHHSFHMQPSFFAGETRLYDGQSWPLESRQTDQGCLRTRHHRNLVGLQTRHGYGWMAEGVKEFSSDESLFEVEHGMGWFEWASRTWVVEYFQEEAFFDGRPRSAVASY
ncbi:hypothetical protein HG531_009625 [Fusarium graminearum]|nr:hypothetical protein HG531_009625 [Fusarium graminearum]